MSKSFWKSWAKSKIYTYSDFFKKIISCALLHYRIFEVLSEFGKGNELLGFDFHFDNYIVNAIWSWWKWISESCFLPTGFADFGFMDEWCMLWSDHQRELVFHEQKSYSSVYADNCFISFWSFVFKKSWFVGLNILIVRTAPDSHVVHLTSHFL